MINHPANQTSEEAPNPRGILGAIEGFYGVFYTSPERDDLIRWMGRHGFNFYLYGPKNDRQHRARWREPYPPRFMEQFAATVETARSVGIDFCYGISPGSDICYSAADDFACLAGKLRSFYDLGVRRFALLLDDNEPGFRHATDQAVNHSLPEAQAALANHLLDWLLALDPSNSLVYCPAEYWGKASGCASFSSALVDLCARLDPHIDIFYTGPEICSPSISAADVADFTAATGRVPLLWDNYPVNDLTMQPELHLAPLTGRDPDLLGAVKGLLFNLSAQAEASKIPLYTAAAYAHCKKEYDPESAFTAAINEIAGTEYTAPLRILADVCNISCLGCAGQLLELLANHAVEALRSGSPVDCPTVFALEEYLTQMDESGYTLKFRLENLALRNNLLAWIEIMENNMWLARFSLKVLRALEQGRDYLPALSRVNEYRDWIARHPKKIATQALEKIAEVALEKTANFQQLAVNEMKEA